MLLSSERDTAKPVDARFWPCLDEFQLLHKFVNFQLPHKIDKYILCDKTVLSFAIIFLENDGSWTRFAAGPLPLAT